MTNIRPPSIYVTEDTQPRSIRVASSMLRRGTELKKRTGVPINEQIRRAYAAYLEKEIPDAP